MKKILSCFQVAALLALLPAGRAAAAPEVSPAPADAAGPVLSAVPTAAPAAMVSAPAAVDGGEDGSMRRLDDPEEPAPAARHSSRRAGPHNGHPNDDRVSLFCDTQVKAGERIAGSAVAVLGDVEVSGEVTRDAVCVLGDCTVNGTVNGKVVAVLGDVHLGPLAHVIGDVVCVGGGDVARAAGAVVDGRIIHKGDDAGRHLTVPLHIWYSHALALGRPLALAHGLGWLWASTACLVAFYALLTVMFPEGIRRTGDVLVQRPLAVVFSALLSAAALPIVFVLLCVTVVGIPVAFVVLPLALVLAVLFGKAAIYVWIGRRLTHERSPLAVCLLIGAAIFIVLYFVPVLGLTLWFVLGLLGFGCAVVVLLQRPARAPALVAVGVVPMMPPGAVPAGVAAGAFAAAAEGPGRRGAGRARPPDRRWRHRRRCRRRWLPVRPRVSGSGRRGS